MSFSQKVVLTAVPIAPDKVRRKFDKPAAPASRSSETLDSVIVVIGTKKHATPMP